MKTAENQWRPNEGKHTLSNSKHTDSALIGINLYKFTSSDDQIYNTDKTSLRSSRSSGVLSNH